MNTNNDSFHRFDPEIRIPRKIETVVSCVAATALLVGIAVGVYFHNKELKGVSCRQRAAVKKCLSAGDMSTDDGKKEIKACANSSLNGKELIGDEYKLGKLVREVSSGGEESGCEEAPAD